MFRSSSSEQKFSILCLTNDCGIVRFAKEHWGLNRITLELDGEGAKEDRDNECGCVSLLGSGLDIDGTSVQACEEGGCVKSGVPDASEEGIQGVEGCDVVE